MGADAVTHNPANNQSGSPRSSRGRSLSDPAPIDLNGYNNGPQPGIGSGVGVGGDGGGTPSPPAANGTHGGARMFGEAGSGGGGRGSNLELEDRAEALKAMGVALPGTTVGFVQLQFE